jgi:hypothetical protein
MVESMMKKMQEQVGKFKPLSSMQSDIGFI